MTSNAPYLDIDKLCHEAEQSGVAWADAKSAFEALEQTRKSVLAAKMKTYFEEGMTAAKAETYALAEASYFIFVRDMVRAGHAADRARVLYDIARTRIELLRTNASTERAAMGMR